MFFQFFCYKMGKSTGLKGKIKKCVVKKFLNFVLYDASQGTNARKLIAIAYTLRTYETGRNL